MNTTHIKLLVPSAALLLLVLPACSNGGGGGGSNSNNNATVSFDLPSSSSAENSGQPVVVTLSLSAAESVSVFVPFTLGGTATEGPDYTTMAVSPLEIMAGDLVAQITFDIVDDDDCEADEFIEVTLGSPTNADLGSRAVHMATVQDDDGIFIEIEPNNNVMESNAIGTLSTLAPGLSCQILGTIEPLPGEFDLFRHEVSETTLLSIEVVPSSPIADIAFLVAGEFGAPLTLTFDNGTVGPESGTVTIDPAVDPLFHVVVWSLTNNTNYEITISGAMPVVAPGTPASAPSIESTQRNVSFDGGTPRVAISHELK